MKLSCNQEEVGQKQQAAWKALECLFSVCPNMGAACSSCFTLRNSTGWRRCLLLETALPCVISSVMGCPGATEPLQAGSNVWFNIWWALQLVNWPASMAGCGFLHLRKTFQQSNVKFVTFYYPVTDLLVSLERVERKSQTATLWSPLHAGIEYL